MSAKGSPMKFWNNRSVRFQKRETSGTRPAATVLDRAMLMALRDPRLNVSLKDKVKAAIQILQEEEAARVAGSVRTPDKAGE